MKEYIKIPNVFKRETGKGKGKLLENEYSNEYIGYLANKEWVFTEKVDGTNIRVIWDGYRVTIKGRQDSSNIPKHLEEKLNEMFINKETEEIFEQIFGLKEVVLYGEGYGCKINKGEQYRDDVSFILFDVTVSDIWLNKNDVMDIAQKFNIDMVPEIIRGSIQEAVELIKQHPKSIVAKNQGKDTIMEGVVGEPIVNLQDKFGNKIIVKIKCRDFKNL